MKLHLGCGPKKYQLEGWKNVDKDPQCQPDVCYDFGAGIQEHDNSVDEIYFAHSLMYFTHEEVKGILEDCHRILKPEGLIRITEDNKHLRIRNEAQQRQYEAGELANRIEMREFLRIAGFVEIEDAEEFPEAKHHIETPHDYPLATGRPSVYFLTARKIKRDKSPVCYMGLDDFGETNSNLDLLWKLRNHFDNFKVNLFAIPNDNLRESWLNYIKDLGWIQLCVHGYNHLHNEKTRAEGKRIFEDIGEKTLNLLTQKHWAKVYKAPNWDLSDEMYDRLKKLGFKILLKPQDSREGIKHNWEINTTPPDLSELHVYGHVYPFSKKVGSSLHLYLDNILKLPKGTIFKLYE